MKKFNLGDIEIGGETVLVIPEIGINHSGSLDVAKEMVDAAYRSGARLIKHQTHIVEDEMCEEAKKIVPGNAKESIFEIMEQCSLNEDEELELKNYVESKGMLFLSTPFSRAAADRLEKMEVHGYKIGSGELNNYPLIEHIARFGKPMIVSTGMNDIKSISKAVNIMEKHGIEYALMHTTNLYPTKPEWVRLGAMQEMMREFPNIPIGLSDHTRSNAACIAAVALGAKLVERHFTDKMDRNGPDIVCSMDEYALEELISACKDVPMMLSGKKEKIPEETVTSDFAFASVVSISNIKKGDVLTEKNIWIKRPGTGEIPAEKYSKILGRIAAKNIDKDIQISYSMLTSK